MLRTVHLQEGTTPLRMVCHEYLFRLLFRLTLFLGIYPDALPGGFDKPESCGIVKPANVISTSYSMVESEITPFYAIRECNEYGKLGLMGVTIVYSSGDEGVSGHGDLCLNPDG